MNRLPWEILATFRAVMREGSLSAGARALGLAQPTTRRHVEALEKTAGAVLFTRSQSGLVPTAAATAMLPFVEEMAASAEALSRSVAELSAADAGTVRLACSEVMGVEVLPPLLAGFQESHPRIAVELVLSNRNEDLVRRDADIAVRMVRPTQSALVARKLRTRPVGLFATAGYLARHSPVVSPDDLRFHALIGEDRERAMIGALGRLGVVLEPTAFTLRTDSHAAQLAALRAGVGIGACQVALAAAPLVRVLPQIEVPLETWVVTHEDLREERRVRLLFDHLAKALA